MAALPSGHRSGSSTTTHSTLPSPTMQALKIGSFRSSGHVFTRSISQFDDEFAPEGRYSELDLGYDSTDDFDLEPALTSDATTAPSSSHPPSPSLLPADERAFIDIASSSPVRDSFFRSYEHRKTLEEKPGIREDAAAALLSLALPRIGPSRHTPLVSASLARRDESPVAIVSQRPRTPKELSGPSFNMEAYAGAGLDTIRRAPNDGPTENFTAELTLRSDRSSECSITTEEHAGFHTSTSFSSPLRAPSSLPPSSPLPEDAEDIQDENINRSQLPLSRLSSPLPRVLSPHSISVDLVTSILPPGGGELDSSLGKLTQRPAPSSATAVTAEPLSTISPLSSPPSSPFIPPAHFPQSSIKRTQNDQLRPEPVKKKRKLTPPDDEVENKFALVNEAPESASAPGSRRRRRNHSESQRGQPTKKSKKRKPQPADIADDASRMSADHLLSLASDRSDATCPYPTFLSVIVEAFALSRATSLGASALFDAISASYPALISTSASDSTGPRLSPDTLDAVLEWGALRGLFETLRSSGDGVPPTYFYIPTADWEKERVDLYTALGGRSARTVKRTYKQYYWKPVVLPRGGRGRRGVAEEEVKKGWDVDWEE